MKTVYVCNSLFHPFRHTSNILAVRIFISLTVDWAQPVRSIIVSILHNTRTPGASGSDRISLATARLRDTCMLATLNMNYKCVLANEKKVRLSIPGEFETMSFRTPVAWMVKISTLKGHVPSAERLFGITF